MFSSMNELTDIGERVRKLRESKGWSQRKLGSKAGTSGSYVSQLESGLLPKPGAGQLRALAKALNVSLSELTGELVIEDSEEAVAARQMGPIMAALTEGMSVQEAQEFLTMYLEMDEEDRQDILKLMKRLRGQK